MKAKFNRFGPLHDYTGVHVALKQGDRTLLGTIRRVYRREVPASIMAEVQFFCGDAWPFDPALSALEILERTYESI